MSYTIRRWWRRLRRRLSRAGGPRGRGGPGTPSALVSAFLGGASVRECAYLYWHRGVSPELATARDWPAAVAGAEDAVRAYVEELQAELKRLQAEGVGA